MSRILAVVEILSGALHGSSVAAIAFASRLVALRGGHFEILAIGPTAVTAAQALARYGAVRVYTVRTEAAELALECVEAHVPTIVEVARQSGANCIVATATTWGKDIMPRVAVRLDAGYVGDCIGVELHRDRVEYSKTMYAGNIIGACVIETPVAVLTVRQSAIPSVQPTSGRSAEFVAVEPQPPSVAASRLEVLGLDIAKSERPELAEARTVVAGGHGLGTHFFHLLDPLADELGAAIGASRAACDSGDAPGDMQVGQTGKVIAPELYVAVGISGAIQHTAGIRGAKVIVAINKDPQAPIFAIADYGLVGDALEVVPQFVDTLRRAKVAAT